jgi:predicted amidohydrolase YtcJ
MTLREWQLLHDAMDRSGPATLAQVLDAAARDLRARGVLGQHDYAAIRRIVDTAVLAAKRRGE